MVKLNKPRVVIDTNIIVSGIIIARSLPNQLLRAWQKDFFILIISEDILKEIKEVLQKESIREKYHLALNIVESLILTLRLGAELAVSLSAQELPIHCRDEKDDLILGLAVGVRADYLITGDKDLLVLNGKQALGRLKIITVKEFLASVL